VRPPLWTAGASHDEVGAPTIHADAPAVVHVLSFRLTTDPSISTLARASARIGPVLIHGVRLMLGVDGNSWVALPGYWHGRFWAPVVILADNDLEELGRCMRAAYDRARLRKAPRGMGGGR
jgi:hypothetical protein